MIFDAFLTCDWAYWYIFLRCNDLEVEVSYMALRYCLVRFEITYIFLLEKNKNTKTVIWYDMVEKNCETAVPFTSFTKYISPKTINNYYKFNSKYEQWKIGPWHLCEFENQNGPRL